MKKGRKVEKVKFLITSTGKKKSGQLELFHENLEEFKRPNTFLETVKRLGLQLGIQLSDKMINDWEKYGPEHVIDLLEKMQHRKDIENPIGYIIKVLNSSEHNEVAAALENGDVIAHLVSRFRKSKESLPEWLVKQESIKEIEEWMAIDHEQAIQQFDEIKSGLYEILGIKESKKLSEEEKERIKREVEEMMRNSSK
ncbi:hypothetical protein [Peribacillus asahii]|uniref:hypothetical protein n=1 Tax=Peribacillus asahii TaxID=228899 RepID=UPI002079FFC8